MLSHNKDTQKPNKEIQTLTTINKLFEELGKSENLNSRNVYSKIRKLVLLCTRYHSLQKKENQITVIHELDEYLEYIFTKKSKSLTALEPTSMVILYRIYTMVLERKIKLNIVEGKEAQQLKDKIISLYEECDEKYPTVVDWIYRTQYLNFYSRQMHSPEKCIELGLRFLKDEEAGLEKNKRQLAVIASIISMEQEKLGDMDKFMDFARKASLFEDYAPAYSQMAKFYIEKAQKFPPNSGTYKNFMAKAEYFYSVAEQIDPGRFNINHGKASIKKQESHVQVVQRPNESTAHVQVPQNQTKSTSHIQVPPNSTLKRSSGSGRKSDTYKEKVVTKETIRNKKSGTVTKRVTTTTRIVSAFNNDATQSTKFNNDATQPTNKRNRRKKAQKPPYVYPGYVHPVIDLIFPSPKISPASSRQLSPEISPTISPASSRQLSPQLSPAISRTSSRQLSPENSQRFTPSPRKRSQLPLTSLSSKQLSANQKDNENQTLPLDKPSTTTTTTTTTITTSPASFVIPEITCQPSSPRKRDQKPLPLSSANQLSVNQKENEKEKENQTLPLDKPSTTTSIVDAPTTSGVAVKAESSSSYCNKFTFFAFFVAATVTNVALIYQNQNCDCSPK